MNKTYSRIDRLMSAFSWLKEEDARNVLMAKYFLLTRVQKLPSDEVNAAMEEFTNELVITDEEIFKGAVEFASRK